MKTFYGILKILVAFGIVLFTSAASNTLLSLFINHVSTLHYDSIPVAHVLITLLFKNDILSFFVLAVYLPLYIVLVQPSISYFKVTTLDELELVSSNYCSLLFLPL